MCDIYIYISFYIITFQILEVSHNQNHYRYITFLQITLISDIQRVKIYL